MLISGFFSQLILLTGEFSRCFYQSDWAKANLILLTNDAIIRDPIKRRTLYLHFSIYQNGECNKKETFKA